MIPTFNIISFADVNLLLAIFNGVAMVCQQISLIWSVATLAGMVQIVIMTTKASVNATGEGGAVLIKGWMSVLSAFVLATMLTQPSLKGTVTLENLVSGQQASVANVPAVISVVPFVASSMADSLGSLVETAFQGSNAEAPYLASRGNGLMNPLKALLSARTAVNKLPGVTSQINSLVAQCLDSSSGVDFSAVGALVMDAGNANSNQGASVASGSNSSPLSAGLGQVLPSQIGVNSIQISALSTGATSIGVLLAQAAQNTNSFVTDTASGVNAGADALSCASAATQVASNINAALQSAAFASAVTGSVNSTDTPNAQSYSLDTLNHIYLGVRQSSSVLSAAAIGVDQANTELLNLLFEEVVKDNLDCLKADGASKTQCLASMQLRAATEQANIDNASSGQLAMQFAGQFGNYMLALIVGLSPIMIIFMMFKGVDSGKSITIAVHMIVWPYLVTNVGGSLINGMIYYNVGNFIAQIGQGGVVNQSNAAEVYRNFSMQIGAASALLAALPVLMTTVFAMSESAAVVSLGAKMSGSEHFNEKVLSPDLISNSAMVKSGELMSSSLHLGAGAINQMSGAFDGVSAQQSFGTSAREVSASTTKAITDTEQVSSGKRELSDWREAFSSGDYSRLGVSQDVGLEVKNSFESNLQAKKAAEQNRISQEASEKSSTQNVGLDASLSLTGLGLSASAGLQGQRRHSNQTSSASLETQGAFEADSLSEATAEVSKRLKSEGAGRESTHKLDQTSGVTKEYAVSAQHASTLSQSTHEALKSGSSFVAESNRIGSQELAFHSANNKRYAQFLDESRSESQFESRDKFQAYQAASVQDMEHDVIANATNPYARSAIVNHRAMVRMAQDEELSNKDRLIAQSYLAREGLALSGLLIPKSSNTLKNDSQLGVGEARASENERMLAKGAWVTRAVSMGSNTQGAGLTQTKAKSSDELTIELSQEQSLEHSKRAQFKSNLETQKSNLESWVAHQLGDEPKK